MDKMQFTRTETAAINDAFSTLETLTEQWGHSARHDVRDALQAFDAPRGMTERKAMILASFQKGRTAPANLADLQGCIKAHIIGQILGAAFEAQKPSHAYPKYGAEVAELSAKAEAAYEAAFARFLKR